MQSLDELNCRHAGVTPALLKAMSRMIFVGIGATARSFTRRLKM